MNTQKLILSWVCLIFLLASCEKDEETPAIIPDLSTDSLSLLQASIPGNHYTDLIFINENLGFAISNSGEIIKTINGGYDWEESMSPVNFFLSKIQFTDNNTGYIIGGDTTGGYLLKTGNSGQTWQLIDLQTPDKKRPSGMFFLNNTTGFISGEKLFRKTTDGGQTWSEVLISVSQDINDVCFINAREGYAVSDSGKYFKTADGGKNWQAMQANTDDHLKKIYFAGIKAFAKCRTSVFVDLASGDEAFTVPGAAFSFLFLDESKCIGIGQHYETGFLPYGDVFLTNDVWTSYAQKTYNPQSEALNVTAVVKVKNGRILMTGFGAVNSTLIELRY